MKCASDTSAIRARRGIQRGLAKARSIASLARIILRLHSSTDRDISLLYVAAAVKRLILGGLSARGHLDQPGLESRQRVDQVVLRGHHRIDILVGHREFVETG